MICPGIHPEFSYRSTRMQKNLPSAGCMAESISGHPLDRAYCKAKNRHSCKCSGINDKAGIPITAHKNYGQPLSEVDDFALETS